MQIGKIDDVGFLVDELNRLQQKGETDFLKNEIVARLEAIDLLRGKTFEKVNQILRTNYAKMILKKIFFWRGIRTK